VVTNLGKLAVGLPVRPPGLHEVGRGAMFRAEDCVCCMRANSPVSEREHPRTAIAVMLAGTLHVRGSHGSMLLGPGALLLKAARSTHEYRHVDDGGDRTLTFEYDDAMLADAGIDDFDQLAIPGSVESAYAVVLAQRALWSGDREQLEEAALAIAAVAVAAGRGSCRELTLVQARRVAQVLRYIAAHHAEDCSLERLAELAGLSSFHFAREFRAITGQTPRQYVIAVRLRAAATALVATSAPITEIALAVGFGDLSHFITSFRRAFTVSPRRFRSERGRASAALRR